jgi:hypothetical protein
VLHFNCHAGYGIFIVRLSLAVYYAERHLFTVMPGSGSAFFIVMLSEALFYVMLNIVSLLLW